MIRLSAYGTRWKPSSGAAAPGTTLDSTHSEAGFGVGIAPMHGLKLGVSGVWSRLELQGQRSGVDPWRPATELASIQGKNGHLDSPRECS